ncbi:hypothetical protein BFV94_4307 [Alteromonas macleodii]|nr:hypothetical protein BFV93_4695 [Alteromonas macleodii]OES25781.1 hypothetical protein BFV94_4307 [Alteromonas macleodii]OES38963.1 hypothetical protein BFV96_4457 [Alteromonas macleodii]
MKQPIKTTLESDLLKEDKQEWRHCIVYAVSILAVSAVIGFFIFR